MIQKPYHESPTIIEELEAIAANGGNGLVEYIARLKGPEHRHDGTTTVYGIVQMLARLPQELSVFCTDGDISVPTLVVFDWNPKPNGSDWEDDKPFVVFEDRGGDPHIGPFQVQK
jgi:hypothetical protein